MLSREMIERVASCYPLNEEAKDAKVFDADFHYRIVARGYMEMEDLLRVADWKARRAKGYIRRNGPQRVVSATREAFADADPCAAVSALDGLAGVGVPMASAILTVWNPDTFTVIDRNAWATLKRLGRIPPSWKVQDSDRIKPETYPLYLDLCKGLAADFSVSLRTLDKCLWLLNGKTPNEFFNARL